MDDDRHAAGTDVVVVPSAARWRRVVVTIVAVTVGLGVAAAYVRVAEVDLPGRDGLVTLFNLDSEYNVPTIVSVLGLAACAAMLWLVARLARVHAPRDARRFAWLGVVFLYLALDEGARLHERLNAPLAALGWTGSGLLRFGWVLVFGVVLLALVPVYLPLVWRLPRTVRAMTIVAGAMYVGGALVLEMVGGRLYDPQGAAYLATTVVEETLELAGIGLFLLALHRLVASWAPSIRLDLAGVPRDAHQGRTSPGSDPDAGSPPEPWLSGTSSGS